MKKVLKKGLIAGTALSVLLTSMPVLANGNDNAIRLAGKNRIETAIKVAEESFNGEYRNSNKVILAPAADANLVDSLTVAPLAYKLKAPILLNDNKDLLNEDVLREIRKHNIRQVYICTGEGVISNKVIETLYDEGINVIRLGGVNRYETSENILGEFRRLGGKTDNVVVVSGNGIADALSIAPMAASKGMPIFLTSDKDTINDYFGDISKDAKKVFAIGGSGIISDELVNALNAERIAGSNRYETNLNVIKRFYKIKVSDIFMANGSNDHLIDSLTASILAGSKASPIVLSNDDLNNDALNTLEHISNNRTKVVTLGSDKVVSNSIISNILNMINNLKEENEVQVVKPDSISPIKVGLISQTVQKGLKEVHGSYQKTYIHIDGSVKENGIIHMAGKDIKVVKGETRQTVVTKIEDAFTNDKVWKVTKLCGDWWGQSHLAFEAKEKENHVDKILMNTDVIKISQEHVNEGIKEVYVPEICNVIVTGATVKKDGTITVNVKDENYIFNCDVEVIVHKNDTKKQIAKLILTAFRNNELINRVYYARLNEENSTITLTQRIPDNITTKVTIK